MGSGGAIVKMFIYPHFADIVSLFFLALSPIVLRRAGARTRTGFKACSGQEMRPGNSCASSNQNEPRMAADGSSISAALWMTPISRQAT